MKGKPPKVKVELSEAEMYLLREALDSHMYWQISEDDERRDGFVFYPAPGSEEFEEGDEDDRTRWQELHDCEKLISKLDEGAFFAGQKVDGYKKRVKGIKHK